jgi:hypothetical protein
VVAHPLRHRDAVVKAAGGRTDAEIHYDEPELVPVGRTGSKGDGQKTVGELFLHHYTFKNAHFIKI